MIEPLAGAERVLAGAPSLLERAVGYTRGSLALVRPHLLGSPTPCTDWNLHVLLVHMDDSLAAITEAAEIGYVAPPAATATGSAESLVEALRTRACALLGAWAGEPVRPEVQVMGRPVAAPLLAAAGALEIAVHGWDVARACGVDRPLPPALARELLAAASLVVEDADRPARFAPPSVVPPWATDGERLLAFLGRPA